MKREELLQVWVLYENAWTIGALYEDKADADFACSQINDRINDYCRVRGAFVSGTERPFVQMRTIHESSAISSYVVDSATMRFR